MRYDVAFDYAQLYKRDSGAVGQIARAYIELYQRSVEPPPSLTKRQREILEFVKESIERYGYAPSQSEIANKFSLNSLSTVHEHLSALERKGYIVRQHNESRGIRVVEQLQPSNQEK